MRKRVKARDLKVGMHVILDMPWHQHPFFRNSFVLSSEGDILRILNAGIDEVVVDRLCVRCNRPLQSQRRSLSSLNIRKRSYPASRPGMTDP
jgi:hypothetical protein